MQVLPPHPHLQVIWGSMYSGKSSELLKRLRRHLHAKRTVQIFKPYIDDRYAEDAVVTHEGIRFDAVRVHTASEILSLIKEDTEVVGIDEGQFFDEEIRAVCEKLAETHTVIVAGLDMDFDGNPFGPMPVLAAIADFVSKEHAVCVVCGETASHSLRVSGGSAQVLVGAEEYEARCRPCWVRGRKEQQEKASQG